MSLGWLVLRWEGVNKEVEMNQLEKDEKVEVRQLEKDEKVA